MSQTKCRFQERATAGEIAEALEEGRCYRCSVTFAELLKTGQLLEVCGEEHICDLPGGQDYTVSIALCPECHRQAHLDADQNLVPCHAKARRSREWIDLPEQDGANLVSSDAQP